MMSGFWNIWILIFGGYFSKGIQKNKIANDKDNIFTDEWGIQYRKTGQYVNAVTHPLLNLKTKEKFKIIHGQKPRIFLALKDWLKMQNIYLMKLIMLL